MIPVDSPTSLYRLFDVAGGLLYVGIAGNPGRRFEQHQGEKPWWGEVATVRVEHFGTRLEASNAEVVAILMERPRYNVVHNRPRGTPLPPAIAIPGPVAYRFEALRSGIEREGQLWLYAELEYSSTVDNCDSADGDDQLEYYVSQLKRSHPGMLDQVPIYWYVDSDCAAFESAPFQRTPTPPPRHFLSHYTWPVTADGDRLDWFRLPVRTDRFPAFADALGWKPSPLQPYCPLRQIMASRRGGPTS